MPILRSGLFVPALGRPGGGAGRASALWAAAVCGAPMKPDSRVDLDTAVESHQALIRAAFALERLARLPDAVSQLARALETVGERVEYGFERLAGAIEGCR